MKTNDEICFYLPKQLMEETYQNFSAESKLLFAMVFTNASGCKALQEVAALITAIDSRNLTEMYRQYLSIVNGEKREEAM